MEYYPACLCHHGVKGMKWGVRRKLRSKARVLKRRLSSGLPINRNAKKIKVTKTKASSSESLVSEDYKKGHSKKPINQMSNAELQAMVNRLTIENNYASQRKMQQGKSATEKALDYLGKTATALENANKIAQNSKKLYNLYKGEDTDDKKKK